MICKKFKQYPTKWSPFSFRLSSCSWTSSLHWSPPTVNMCLFYNDTQFTFMVIIVNRVWSPLKTRNRKHQHTQTSWCLCRPLLASMWTTCGAYINLFARLNYKSEGMTSKCKNTNLCVFPGTGRNSLNQPNIWLTILLTSILCVLPVVTYRFLFIQLCPTINDKVQTGLHYRSCCSIT